MIDPTPYENLAMEYAVKLLAEYVEFDVGFNTPLSQYSRKQILTLIEVVASAYQDKIASLKFDNKDLPF